VVEAVGVDLQIPDDRTHLSGAAVLLGRPGQLMFSFGVFVGLAFLVQALVLPDDGQAADVAPEGPAVLSNRVLDALDRSGIESSDRSAASPLVDTRADQGRGLVNLLKKVADAPADDLPAPIPADPAGPGTEPPGSSDASGVQGIEDHANAMGHFRESLSRTERKERGAITRIIHFGDSTIVADLVTGTARRKLQQRFGDAGHGFILVGKPWDWYGHQNIKHSSAEAWRLNRVTFNPMKDGRHGLGGVSARAHGPGAWATYANADEGPTGRSFSSFSLFYLGQPGGGDLSIFVDDKEAGIVRTASDKLHDGVETLTFPDGPHSVKVQSRGGGEVRVYGVALERSTPGVVYDSVGISGIRAKTLNRIDSTHFKGQLTGRAPDLVVVNLGTNESEFEGMSMEEYTTDFSELLSRIRAAVPNASCLVASPPDRAKKNTAGRLVTTPMIPRIIEVQKKVAEEKGCAFWNTYEAMGGENSMVAWFRHKPRLGSGDYTHFTAAGGEALGLLFYDALVDDYASKK